MNELKDHKMEDRAYTVLSNRNVILRNRHYQRPGLKLESTWTCSLYTNAVVINNKIAISNVEIMFGVLESVNHNLTENVN